MVTQQNERRQRKEFSLNRIRELAAAGQVAHGSRDVSKDIENLSYSPDDVYQCLVSLTDEDYKESVNYGDHKGWLDEYLITYQSPTGHKDELYIKLKLNRDCVTIVLISFHREYSL
jgi:hypothetical protein